MARRHDVVAALARVDRHGNGARAVARRNARRHTLARLDRSREGGFVPRAVLAAHQFEPERVDARLGQRQADEAAAMRRHEVDRVRSEEHTSELQSLMRISYAVFCLKKKKKT